MIAADEDSADVGHDEAQKADDPATDVVTDAKMMAMRATIKRSRSTRTPRARAVLSSRLNRFRERMVNRAATKKIIT